MAKAGVAPGAVIYDAEGENLGANQEIPQKQAQGEVVVNIMNQVLIWIGFDVVANRQALCSEIAEIKDMVDLTEKDITELQESYCVGLGCADFMTVCLFFTQGTGVTAVGGVTMCPTLGSIVVIFAVAGLGLHGGHQGGHLRLGGIGRGLDACHSKRVFRWRWSGYCCRKGRSGDHCCDVSDETKSILPIATPFATAPIACLCCFHGASSVPE